MPDTPGMAMSSSMTSGWSERGTLTASSPLAASPTTTNPGLRLEQAAQSLPEDRVVVGDDDT